MKLTLAAILVAFLSFAAAAQQPVIQAHLEPTKNILVGQPVRLVVTVYVPNYFTGSPDFPEFEIENAIVVLPQDRPANSNTEINGTRYAGITETYVIYPQQAGDFRLPQATLTVPYTITPPKSVTATSHLPALTFHADVPAAARDLDYFLPTTNLTIQQQWSVPLKNLRVGDSVQRTITVTATKMQAMLIPPLRLDAPDGLRIYPDEPTVLDQKTPRGDFVFGRRIQSARYFIQKEGDYTLPAVELKWWNLATGRLVSATLPPVHFAAAPNPDYAVELPPEPQTQPAQPVHKISPWKRYHFALRTAFVIAIAGTLCFLLARRYLPRIYRRVHLWHEKRTHSEGFYFRNLQRSCAHNDARRAYDQLVKWFALNLPKLSFEQALQRVNNSDLSAEAGKLGAYLFAEKNNDRPWNGRRLASLLRKHHKTHRDQSRQRNYLDELNP